MLISSAWFEIIAAALLTTLIFATSYRPVWWFWSGASHRTNAPVEVTDRRKFKTVSDVPGPYSLPILGTRWIFSGFGSYTLNKIHDAYKGTCTLILGRHLGFLKPDSSSEIASRLAEAVRVHFTASRDAFYGLPLWKLLPTSAYKQLIESEDTIYNIISDIVEATIWEKRDDAKDESVEAVFQSILRQKSLDVRDKKAAIVDFIAAGIHTLGNTLVFLFDLIGRNPAVQAKLYEESCSLAPPGCDLTIENLRKAKYLRACIIESFRKIPTTTCIARILDEPLELSGYRLNAGTVVLLHTWIAGLNEDNFKDASEYLPERWLTPVAPHSPLLVAPFGAGRRICPGKRFVELALQLILAKIVREFEIIVDEELGLQFEFILAPKSPVVLGFRDRSLKA
nr:PREDICTED: ecdysone 20-monooxygenase isoform X3 [Megachile rotundata]